MILLILFLILILFFNDISIFGTIFFGIYMICKIIPEIISENHNRKKQTTGTFFRHLF